MKKSTKTILRVSTIVLGSAIAITLVALIMKRKDTSTLRPAQGSPVSVNENRK